MTIAMFNSPALNSEYFSTGIRSEPTFVAELHLFLFHLLDMELLFLCNENTETLYLCIEEHRHFQDLDTHKYFAYQEWSYKRKTALWQDSPKRLACEYTS